MRSIPDKTSQFGPPDHFHNFVTTSRKRATDSSQLQSAPKRQALYVDNSMVEYIPNSHPEILG